MAGTSTASSPTSFADYGRIVEQRAREAASSLAQTFDSYFDGQMREVTIQGLAQALADEGTIWIIDEPREHLIPVFNSGPSASDFVGNFKQSLNAGMISMVVATEQPICENQVQRNQRQDRRLDSQLGVETCAMIAAPFYFAGELRGVISGVQLRPADASLPEPGGFRWDQLQTLQRTAALFARLLEHKILNRVLNSGART